MQAVDQFRNAKYDDAINAFIELDINPAKVVALYPESISGRLSVPPDEWIPLFGGPKPVGPPPTSPSASATDVSGTATEQEGGTKSVESPPRAGTPQGSIRNVLLKTGLESLVSTGMAKDDDTTSIRSVRRPPKPGA